MRVTIEHKETKEPVSPTLTGVLFASVIPALKTTVYRVSVSIQFSEEELAIIKQRNLSKIGVTVPPNRVVNDILSERLRDTKPSPVLISELIRDGGLSLPFYTVPEAQEFETFIRESFLPSLKNLIMSTADYGSAKTFEV